MLGYRAVVRQGEYMKAKTKFGVGIGIIVVSLSALA